MWIVFNREQLSVKLFISDGDDGDDNFFLAMVPY